MVITALLFRILEAKGFFFNENRLLRLRLRDIFSVTPSILRDSNLKLIITPGRTNAGRLNFVWWRLTGLILEQVSPFFPHIQKCVKVHTNKVGNRIIVHPRTLNHQHGTCFMSPILPLEYGRGSYIFVRFVDPTVTVRPKSYSLTFSHAPHLTPHKQCR